MESYYNDIENEQRNCVQAEDDRGQRRNSKLKKNCSSLGEDKECKTSPFEAILGRIKGKN